MPKKCKNPLMAVSATIAYYMELSNISNKELCEKLTMAPATWIQKKKNPEKFNLGELSVIAKIFNVDLIVLIGGLIPKEERSI